MKNNNSYSYLIPVIAFTLVINIASSFIQSVFINDTEDEVIEEVFETTECMEYEKDDNLFIEVYSQGLDYKLFYFKPTGVMYVSGDSGEPVMMEDELGNPITYQYYLNLLEK